MNVTRTRSLVVTLVAVAGLAACGQGADSDADTNALAEDTSSSATVALTADPSSAGKCAAPNPETLAGFDSAFEGTVTSLDDGTATLAVEQWYAGGDAGTVTVVTPSKALEDLLMAVDFKEDQTYLVSATGGRVTLCGFTGEKTPDLEAIYASAFGS